MGNEMGNWLVMLPEILVVGTAFVCLVVAALRPEVRSGNGVIALVGLVAALVVLFTTPRDGFFLGGRFVVDPLAWWFKLMFLVSGVFTVLLSQDVLSGRAVAQRLRMDAGGEYFFVLLSTLAGMMFLISSRDLISMYVSLELATIPLFLLTAWKRYDDLSGEAGLKFVVLGSMASGALLYGLSLMYGLAGSMDLDSIRAAVQAAPGSTPALWVAFVLILAGVGFKLTLVPFHMWAADVYQGAPSPITAWLSVASKAAGLAFLFQLLYRIMGTQDGWIPIIAWMSFLTMTVGNLIAIVQTNIKRFMAFSAISQAGYLLMGFLGRADIGVPAVLFYMLVYLLSNLLVFAVIIFYGNEIGREQIDDYRGLSRLHPFIAAAMMLGLFSLAGIPPLAGFTGKFFLFSVASQAGYHWLVVAAAVNSTISLYYYLRIVKQMYIEPLPEDDRRLPVSGAVASAVGLTLVATVLFGLVPLIYRAIESDTAAWARALGL